MFSKSSNKRSTPALPSRAQPDKSDKPESNKHVVPSLTIVAQGVEITGNMVTTGEVQLDGTIKGDIRCGALTIGEGGVLIGSVVAERVAVRGSVQGIVSAKNVVLERTAQVTGDVSQESISVEAGAQLDGRLLRKTDLPRADLPINGAADSQPALKAVN